MNDDVPDFLRRLWRLPEAPARLGRRSTLDVETVVATAVMLADEGGLGAATLPKVAERLGVTPMSLYRYVGSKQELLQLMMDAASAPGGDAEPPADWHDGLRRWATDLWNLYRARPWLPQVPIYRMPSGPNQMAWLERGLAAMTETGLGADRKLMVIGLLSGYVRHSAILAQELDEGQAPVDPSIGDEFVRALGGLVDAERYPNVAVLLSGAAMHPDRALDAEAPSDFDAGLGLILDGLATRIREGA